MAKPKLRCCKFGTARFGAEEGCLCWTACEVCAAILFGTPLRWKLRFIGFSCKGHGKLDATISKPFLNPALELNIAFYLWAEVAGLIGKETYEFGDISREIARTFGRVMCVLRSKILTRPERLIPLYPFLILALNKNGTMNEVFLVPVKVQLIHADWRRFLSQFVLNHDCARNHSFVEWPNCMELLCDFGALNVCFSFTLWKMMLTGSYAGEPKKWMSMRRIAVDHELNEHS